jgi:hypothetical protein
MPPTTPPLTRAEWRQMHRERRELILAAVRAGTVYQVIGDQFGVSKARVANIAKQAGIIRRPRKPKV